MKWTKRKCLGSRLIMLMRIIATISDLFQIYFITDQELYFICLDLKWELSQCIGGIIFNKQSDFGESFFFVCIEKEDC